jgi:stage IV sporulation protein FB
MAREGIDGPLISLPVVSRHGIFVWLLSTLVSVRYTFLVVMILMAGVSRRSLAQILVWVVAATLGVLVHEFGHVAAARYYGHRPRVELYTMGGLTSWSNEGRPGWVERLSTSLAGPVVGLLVAGALWLGLEHWGGVPGQPLLYLAFHDFMWVCAGWSLLNLAPILPLDGGQALEALLYPFRVRQPRRTAQLVSIGAGAALAVLAFTYGWTWAAVLAGLLAYNNAQAVRGLPTARIVG